MRSLQKGDLQDWQSREPKGGCVVILGYPIRVIKTTFSVETNHKGSPKA